MTSHHDVTRLVEAMRSAAQAGIAANLFIPAANKIESQAKALSEAEREATAYHGFWIEERDKWLAAEARLAEVVAERDAWCNRESETQESLQAIGDEFGVYGGEPRTHGIRRVLTEMRAFRAEAMKVIERGMEALTEADAQIEYLHYKFKPTGSGATAIARIDIALTAARAFTNAAKTQESKDA